MMRRHSFAALAVAALGVTALALGCADTNAPLPDPEEVLLAVNSTANTLSIVPVEAPSEAMTVPLGGTTPTPVGVSAREGVAIVPLGLDNAVAVVDLRTASVTRTIPLPDNSGATGSAIVDDSIAYVGNPNINTVSRINYLTGATSEVPVGVYPSGLIFTRGKVFVLNGNLDETFSPAGPSWLTVIDPATNAAVAAGIDSIPLTGDGNAVVRRGGLRRPALRHEHRQLLLRRGAALGGGSAGTAPRWPASPASAPAPATWPPMRTPGSS